MKHKMHYLDFLETAHEYDLALARAQSKRSNLELRRQSTGLDDRQFVKKYRLSKDVTKKLINELTPLIPPTLRSDSLDVETKVLIALDFYATGSHQSIVGGTAKHSVSQASVSKSINQVTLALNEPQILNKYIAFPFKRQDRELIKQGFYSKFKMPVLGCIGGTHVAIVCPDEHKERYYNRKKFHSLNVLVMCDSNLNIICVDPTSPGSTHDSVVWANHPLNEYIERQLQQQKDTTNEEDLYILGDSGYPLRCTLMTPITDPLPNSPEELYHDLHLNARSSVEQCISVLKARFRCLLVNRRLHYSPEAAAKIVNACCVLHNIAHRAHLPFTPLTAEEAALERTLAEGSSNHNTNNIEHGATALAELQLGRKRQRALIERLWVDRDSD